MKGSPGLATPAISSYNHTMKFERYKNDILLMLALLVLAGSVWGALHFIKKQGGEAVISIDGEIVERLPLRTDTAVTLTPTLDDFNTVVVENGRVCVLDANCPDRTCVRQGWIQYEGESIVCLPHRLVVTVQGRESGVDAAAG